MYFIREKLFPIHVLALDLDDPSYTSWVCNASQTKEIYDTYTKVRDVLEEHHYDHWLGYGSLIGGARHKGIIPWDDDVDLVVIVENDERQYRLMEILRDRFPADQLAVMGFGVQINNYVDLFYYSYRPDIKKYQITNRVMYVVEKDKKDKHSFTKEELYPLQKIKFGPTYAWVPNQHIKVLDRTYHSWDTHAVIQIPHQVSVHNSNWKEMFYRSILRFALKHGIKVSVKDITGREHEVSVKDITVDPDNYCDLQDLLER